MSNGGDGVHHPIVRIAAPHLLPRHLTSPAPLLLVLALLALEGPCGRLWCSAAFHTCRPWNCLGSSARNFALFSAKGGSAYTIRRK